MNVASEHSVCRPIAGVQWGMAGASCVEVVRGSHHFLYAEVFPALVAEEEELMTGCLCPIEARVTVQFAQHAIVPAQEAVAPYTVADVHVLSLVPLLPEVGQDSRVALTELAPLYWSSFALGTLGSEGAKCCSQAEAPVRDL